MYQYAALANKLPITLRNGKNSGGVLRKEEEHHIIFDTIEEIQEEIHKLLTDISYYESKCDRIADAVISEREFDECLTKLMNNQLERYDYNEFCYDDSANKEYLKNYTFENFCCDIYNGNSKLLFLAHFTIWYMFGIVFKIYRKCKTIWRR